MPKEDPAFTKLKNQAIKDFWLRPRVGDIVSLVIMIAIAGLSWRLLGLANDEHFIIKFSFSSVAFLFIIVWVHSYTERLYGVIANVDSENSRRAVVKYIQGFGFWQKIKHTTWRQRFLCFVLAYLWQIMNYWFSYNEFDAIYFVPSPVAIAILMICFLYFIGLENLSIECCRKEFEKTQQEKNSVTEET